MAGAALAMRPAVWGLHCLLGRPRDSMVAILVASAIGAIVVNSLMLQKGPHPAPIFAHAMPGPSAVRGDVLVRRNNEFVPPAPLAAASAPPVQRTAVSDEPTGAIIPVLPRARPPEAPPKAVAAATRPAAVRRDPIGDLITPSQHAARAPQTTAASPPPAVAAAPTTHVASAPLSAATPSQNAPQSSPQVASVQRVLSAFGYLQMSPNGIMGPETKKAIEDFERERRLPVTGQVSDRLVRELSTVTGKPL